MGAVGAEVGAFAGAEALASSKAANGCELLSWPGVDDCARGGDVSETVVERSDAIPGILGTGEPLEAT
jgi:hypothetical protein